MFISTTSFPPDGIWDQILRQSLANWNSVGGSGFTFSFGRDTDGRAGLPNGVNEVYARTISDPGVLAVTLSVVPCYSRFDWSRWRWISVWGIRETDVQFDPEWRWSISYVPDQFGCNDCISLGSVALHEFGHALGLKHEDRWQATMNSLYPNGGPLGRRTYVWEPIADDRMGIRFLYPSGDGEVNIAASSFHHRRYSDGQASSNENEVVEVPQGTAFYPTTTGERVPILRPGSWIDIAFTFSNLGTSRVDFDLGFFLSANTVVDPTDLFLGANQGAWATPGFTGSFRRRLFIPEAARADCQALATGGRGCWYWIMYEVDYDHRHVEANEENNSVYLFDRVIVAGEPLG